MGNKRKMRINGIALKSSQSPTWSQQWSAATTVICIDLRLLWTDCRHLLTTSAIHSQDFNRMPPTFRVVYWRFWCITTGSHCCRWSWSWSWSPVWLSRHVHQPSRNHKFLCNFHMKLFAKPFNSWESCSLNWKLFHHQNGLLIIYILLGIRTHTHTQ